MPEEAILDFNKAIGLNPNYAFAYRNRGKSEIQLNQNSKACTDFNKALELGDSDAAEFIDKHCNQE